MIVACLMAVMLNGTIHQIYMTGNVVKKDGSSYIVDFSHAASFIGLKGEYSKMPINSENCVIK
jgi:hypothetical protein